MNFGDALQLLKDGWRVARTGWNGKGMYLELARCDRYAHGPTAISPYIFISTADQQIVPWTASQMDILSEDWAVVDETEDSRT